MPNASLSSLRSHVLFDMFVTNIKCHVCWRAQAPAPWTKPQDGNMFKTQRKTTDNACPSNLTVERCFKTLACRGSTHVDSYKDGNEPSRSRKGETFVECLSRRTPPHRDNRFVCFFLFSTLTSFAMYSLTVECNQAYWNIAVIFKNDFSVLQATNVRIIVN